MRIYFLTGLGTDERVFRYLNLELPDDYKVVHIKWIQPIKSETLTSYAKRISEFIDDSSPFIIVGLSFGGILANEIVQFKKPEKVILVSSIKSKKELPLHFRLAGKLGVHKFIPGKYFKKTSLLKYWVFGLKNAKEREILNEILSASNPAFSKWAIHHILNWKATKNNLTTVRIHGDNDRVLPITGFMPDYLVKYGGHFMIVTHAGEISEIIRREILNKV